MEVREVSQNRQDTDKPKRKAPSTAFKPGQSGNPGGKKAIPQDIKDALSKLTPTAVDKLKQMLEDPNTDYKVLIQVINTILDRVYGKAPQTVDATGEIKIILEGALSDYGD